MTYWTFNWLTFAWHEFRNPLSISFTHRETFSNPFVSRDTLVSHCVLVLMCWYVASNPSSIRNVWFTALNVYKWRQQDQNRNNGTNVHTVSQLRFHLEKLQEPYFHMLEEQVWMFHFLNTWESLNLSGKDPSDRCIWRRLCTHRSLFLDWMYHQLSRRVVHRLPLHGKKNTGLS